ncbi:MAG: NHL repeat-containing protein [bacterium]
MKLLPLVLVFLPFTISCSEQAESRYLNHLFSIYYGKAKDDPLGSVGGIAVDTQSEEIYIADSSNRRLVVFNKNGDYITDYRNFGNLPSAGNVTIGRDGNVLVTTGFSPLIAVISPIGKFIKHTDLSVTPDGVAHPAKIVIDNEGRYIVQDIKNLRVLVFSDDWEFQYQLGTKGAEKGGLLAPAGLATDIEGNIYITDMKQKMVSVFSADGKFIRRFGTPGAGEGTLSRPSDVALDSQGRVYVLDSGRHTILVYDSGGNFLYEKGGFGNFDGAFNSPYTMMIDRTTNRLLTAEPYMSRVQVFKLDVEKSKND